jgi:trehalose utilization protein
VSALTGEENMSLNVKKEATTWLTQTDLANRWQVSAGTIKNWRDAGHLPFFRLPGSSKVLYSINHVEEVEKSFTTATKKVIPCKEKYKAVREKPVVSTKQIKEWRI